MTASREGGEEVEGLSKQEKGLMDMDNSVVIAGEGSIRGLNGNRKTTIKTKLGSRKMETTVLENNKKLIKKSPIKNF